MVKYRYHLVATTTLVVASLLAAPLVLPASALDSGGLLELDGNVRVDGVHGILDWGGMFDAAGNTLPLGAHVVRATFAADYLAPDVSYHAGSDKDIEPIETWECTAVNKPQDKTDILNAYSTLVRAADGSHHLYFGFERATNNGNAYVGFWLMQQSVGCTPPPGGSASFTGSHTEGDLLILSDFTGGGRTPIIQVYRWDTTVPDNLRLISNTADCDRGHDALAACGRVNVDPMLTPWAPSNVRPLGRNQFFEGGIDLTAALGSPRLPCFGTFMAETRTSQSVTAQLKDYAASRFETCTARISIGPAVADNPVGTTHDFTVTVSADQGSGFLAVQGTQVQATILSGPGSFVNGVSTCTTDTNGRCTVRITSATAGATVVKAGANVTLGGTVVRVETDGTGASGGPATKLWFKRPSSIVTTPATSSLLLSQTITDTATVTGTGIAPTGQVTFHVCSPAQVLALGGTCSAGGTLVGHATLSNGIAVSPAFAPTSAGTWCFRATYPGDATYNASAEWDVNECFRVREPATSISIGPAVADNLLGQAHDFTVTLTATDDGQPISTAGVLVQGSIPAASPGWFVDGISTCTTGQAGTCVLRVVSDQPGITIVSASASIPVGTLTFYRETNGTGANSPPAAKHWFKWPSATVTTPSAASIVLGASVLDRVVVAGNSGTPTGSVAFFACSPAQVTTNGGTCSAGGRNLGSIALVNGAGDGPLFIPDELGTWCFRGEYGGDALYNRSEDSSTSECFRVRAADVTIAITPAAADNLVGDPHRFTVTVLEHDDGQTTPSVGATVQGALVSGPGSFVDGISSCTTNTEGTCSFFLVSNEPGVSVVSASTSVHIGGVRFDRATDGAGGNPAPAVKHWFKWPSLTTTTPSATSIVLGAGLVDDVIVTGAGPTPTGTVAFFVCTPTQVIDQAGACTVGGTSLGSIPLVDGAGTGPRFVPDEIGTWCFRAEYSGDAWYNMSDDSLSDECFRVRDADVLISIGPAAADNLLGQRHEFLVTVLTRDGDTIAPAVGAVVDGTLVSGPGDFVDGVSSCTTGSDGTCILALVSTEVGVSVVSASTSFVFESVRFDRATDGLQGNPSPAVKHWFKWPSLTTTRPSAASIVLGASIFDDVVVAGDSGLPTGTVLFFACNPALVIQNGGTCDIGGVNLGSILLQGAAGSGPIFVPDEAGTWCFRGEYSGDAWYNASEDASTAECFEVRDVDVIISIGPAAADNLLGEPHEFLVTVLTRDGQTISPAVGAVVQGTLVGGPGAFADDVSSCTTGEEGTCVLTLVSEETGISIVAASTSVLIEGVRFDRSTDGLDDNPSPAVKHWFKWPSATVTTPSAASIVLGASIFDNVVVSGDRATPQGTVAFHVCDPAQVAANGGTCSAGGSSLGSITLADGIGAGPIFVPNEPGTWCFRGEYSGDAWYNASEDASTAECFLVQDPTIIIQIGPPVADNRLGEPHEFVVTVDAALDGAPVDADGSTVTAWIVSGPGTLDATTCILADGSCTLTLRSTEPGISLVAASVTVSFGNVAVTRDTDDVAGSSAPAAKHWFKWESATVTTPSFASLTLGGALTDGVTVTSDHPTQGPTGTVQFFACNPTEVIAHGGTCASGGTDIGSVPLVDGAAHSLEFTPTAAGTWCFRGEYSGDALHNASYDSSEGECFDVLRATPGISTLSDPTGGGLAPGITASDTATLTGAGPGIPLPTGALEFFLCGPGESTLDGCPEDAGTLVGPVTLDAAAQATSALVTSTLERGRYCWRVAYEGDANYEPAWHTDGDAECFRIEWPLSSLVKDVRVGATPWDTSADARPGAVVEYRLIYANDGNAKATNVVVTDLLPVGTTFHACDACTFADDIVQWTLGDVEAGGTRTLTFSVLLPEFYDAGTHTIPNSASGESDEEGEFPSNEVDVTVTATPALGLAKAASSPTVLPAGRFTYTLAYWNGGDGHALDATLEDPLPEGLAVITCDGCDQGLDGVLRWDLGRVHAGTTEENPAGMVSIVVELLGRDVCTFCNLASIRDPAENDGAPTFSNLVCVELAHDVSLAESEGASIGAHILISDLGIDELFKTSSSSQLGPGAQSHEDHQEDILATVPGVGTLRARILDVTTTSLVSVLGVASQVSVAETVNVNILNGVVRANVVRAVSTTTVDGATASFSSEGSTIEGLVVQGVAITDIHPDMRIDLPSLGAGSYVALYERSGTVTRTVGDDFDTHASNLRVTMIRVHVAGTTVAGLVIPAVDIIVSDASSHSGSPVALVCAPSSERPVGADAAVVRLTTNPEVGPIVKGATSVEDPGLDEEALVEVDVDGTGSALVADGALSRSAGQRTPTAATAWALARVENACVLRGQQGCLLGATLLESQATASATATGTSTQGSSILAGLIVNGVPVMASVPANTRIDIPNVGYVILNEQVDAAGSKLVRAVRVVLTANVGGFVAGTELVIAEAHAAASWTGT